MLHNITYIKSKSTICKKSLIHKLYTLMCFNQDATNNCHFLQQMYLIAIFGIIVKIA